MAFSGREPVAPLLEGDFYRRPLEVGYLAVEEGPAAGRLSPGGDWTSPSTGSFESAWASPSRQGLLEGPRFQLPSSPLRRLVWDFLTGEPCSSPGLQRASAVYQVVIAALVVVLFLVDGRGMTAEAKRLFQSLELFAVCFFSLDYILRLYSCIEGPPRGLLPDCLHDSLATACGESPSLFLRLRFALSLGMAVDLLSISSLALDLALSSMPDQLRALVWLRFVRLLNLSRVERNFRFLRPVGRVVWQKRRELGATSGIAGLLLLISSATMYYIESPVNDEFSSILVSMWWATSALTTVGYGDICPVTALGRIFGSVVAFIGVGLFVLPASIVTSGFQEAFNEEERRRGRGKALELRAASPSGSLASGGWPQDSASCALEALLAEVQQLRAEGRAAADSLRADVVALQEGQRQILEALMALQASGQLVPPLAA